ncbi:hypothetical protein TNIN_357281 [Trichonephila inaurata madagascariensis]|uniref:Uncharacterized protein n=1 Tax=Trichonephila inaurata madagascariensis TaxID=2747483 RepID=A0A8X6WX93_9ARAC|nr:hypothetical protein TNIN_357281 [Trichonephila inaurata madagascariensis]
MDKLKSCFSDNFSQSAIESSIGEDTPIKPAEMPKKKMRLAPFLLHNQSITVSHLGERSIRCSNTPAHANPERIQTCSKVTLPSNRM